jgi:hypothetical protein
MAMSSMQEFTSALQKERADGRPGGTYLNWHVGSFTRILLTMSKNGSFVNHSHEQKLTT